MLLKSVEESPHSIENLVSLAKLHLNEKNKTKAKQLYEKALQMAQEQKTSYWYLNQLNSEVKALN